MVEEIPDSWALATLRELGTWSGGGTPSKTIADYWDGDIPWVSPKDMKQDVIFDSGDHITQRAIDNSAAKLIPPGSILVVTRSGILAHTFPVAVTMMPVTVNQDIKALTPFPGIDAKYLSWLLRAHGRKILETCSKDGTTVNSIETARLHAYPVLIAPTNEQCRIVAKIDELFSELDKGTESLKAAQAQLKVYRQALLKHAFEGRLTAQWRADNPDKVETVDALLKRTQHQRIQRYQQRLSDWDCARQNRKPRALKLPPALTAEELAKLRALPEGWRWTKFGQIFNVYVGSTPSRKRPDFWNGCVPWVSSGEVAFCRIRSTAEKITPLGLENTSTEVHPVGTIMLAMIGEGKTRGQAAILDVEAAHNQNTAAIRVSEADVSPEFIYNYLVYQYEITRKVGSGNNQKALNKERVSDLIFPLCSVAEMNEIVRLIDEKLTEVGHLDQILDTALQQAEVLRQAILKKAFSGQIVPQDLRDAPASVLLARIKAEKSALPQVKKGNL